MNLSLEVAKSFFGKVLQALLGFAGTIIFARVLGPSAFGGYYLLLSVVQLVDRPFDGWSSGVKKRFSEYDGNRQELLGSQLVVNVVGLIICSIVAFVAQDRLIDFTGIDEALPMFVLLLVSMIFFQPSQQMLDAIGKPAFSTWVDTARSFLTTALQLLLVLLGFGAAGMAYGLAGATIVTILISFYYLGVSPKRPSLETFRSVGDFFKYSFPATILGQAYDRYDVLLLGFLLGPAAAGDYEVALKLTIPAILISNSISGALLPRISYQNSKGETVGEDVTNAVAFGSLSAIPIFFGALAIPETLVVTIYGPDYETAGALIAGIALIRIIHIQTGTLNSTLQGIDRPDLPLRVSAVALVVNIVIGYVLVLEIGALGAVIGTIVASGLRYIIMAYYVKQLVENVRLLPRPFIEQCVAGGVMFLVVEVLHATVVVRSWVELLFIVSCGAAVFGVVLLTISAQLRTLLQNVFVQFPIVRRFG
jgi:O-antigen/teichoic acid export membrane protein